MYNGMGGTPIFDINQCFVFGMIIQADGSIKNNDRAGGIDAILLNSQFSLQL